MVRIPLRAHRPAMLIAGLLYLGSGQAADLLSLYERAEEVDPRLERARKETTLAEYQRDQAQATLMPRLSADASTRRVDQEQVSDFGGQGAQTNNYDYTQDRYSFTLTQPLFMGGRTWLSLDLASLAQEQATEAVSETRQNVMVEVAEAYFAVLDAREELDLAEREVRRVEEHLERARAQYEVGTGDITGVREAEARRDQAKTRLIQARNQLRNARQQLRRLIRRDPPALKGVAEVALAEPDPGNAKAWVKRALENSPQLAQLRKDQRMAHKQADLARRDRWPELTAQAQYSDVDGGANVISSEETSASLNLSWPIYQGGNVGAEAAMEETQAVQAGLSLDNRRQEIRVQTVQAFNDWQSAMQEVRSLRAQVRSTKTQLDAIETGFEVGRRTSVDVLDAQQEYFDALSNLAQARHKYLLARIQLRATAGVLDRGALADANRQLDKKANSAG